MAGVGVRPGAGPSGAVDAGLDPVRAVVNQPPPLQDLDLFTTDLALTEGLVREGGGEGLPAVREAGVWAGSAEAAELATRAERNEPRLDSYDRHGRRVDAVVLDPAWHALLDEAVRRGIHALPWLPDAPAGAHVVRAALVLLWAQVDAGVMCPLSMTYAAVPALRDGAPALAAAWEGSLLSRDPATVALAGMAMTERQGGSDVRANLTRATPDGDGGWRLRGHKWFCSYPPCRVFLTLAQTDAGLSCFLVERGPGMEFQRLKDKLGTRSLPSSEVEFRDAPAALVGEAGRGVPAILRMVNHTRLDCALGAAASLRRGTLEAVHHARHRRAFGARLVDQPLMAAVLADLALESEAACAAVLRLARAYDAPGEGPLRRLLTAVLKYWVTKRAAGHAAEALECLGGNGYVEDSGLPRLYRDAPLNSIWEGSGNVAALDVLRAVAREPAGVRALLAECALAAGAEPRLDAHLAVCRRRIDALPGLTPAAAQAGARGLAQDLALAVQGALLVRHAPPAVADGFCASRLGEAGGGGRAYGVLPAGVDTAAILARALPA